MYDNTLLPVYIEDGMARITYMENGMAARIISLANPQLM